MACSSLGVGILATLKIRLPYIRIDGQEYFAENVGTEKHAMRVKGSEYIGVELSSISANNLSPFRIMANGARYAIK